MRLRWVRDSYHKQTQERWDHSFLFVARHPRGREREELRELLPQYSHTPNLAKIEWWRGSLFFSLTQSDRKRSKRELVRDIYICTWRRRSKLLHFVCLNKSDQNQANERNNLPKGENPCCFWSNRLREKRREPSHFSMIQPSREKREL
jgi:hypothetical protein